MRTATGIRKDPQDYVDRNLVVQGETGAFTVACTEQGDGPPVVLLHCNASSRHQWRSLIGELSGRFRVLAPDLFGHGGSPLPAEPAAFTVADEVAMVAAVIRRAGGPVHLVGHSYGGGIALKASVALPRGVRSLTLVEPSVFELLRHAGDTVAWEEIRRVAEHHVQSVRQGAPERAADAFMGYWMGRAAWKAMPEARRAAICATMPAVARAWEIILGERTGLGEYARIDAPALLVRGEATHAPCTRVVDQLRGTLPNVRPTTIRDAGHMAPLTHPEPVNAAIAAHLRCCAGPDAPRTRIGPSAPVGDWRTSGTAAVAT